LTEYIILHQEVEGETGSAEEQPVSNKLPALRCNKFIEGDSAYAVLQFVTDIALWLKKPDTIFVLLITLIISVLFSGF
jgi:hypothetical protein